MEIEIVAKSISLDRLREHAQAVFGDMVKVAVDIEKKVMAVGGELHVDDEVALLKAGSKQKDIWGANIYPDLSVEERIEYVSMINIRPSQNNRSREIQDDNVRQKVKAVIEGLIE